MEKIKTNKKNSNFEFNYSKEKRIVFFAKISRAPESLKAKEVTEDKYEKGLKAISLQEIDAIPASIYKTKDEAGVKKLHDLFGKLGITIGSYEFGSGAPGYGKYGPKTRQAVNILEKYLKEKDVYKGALDDGKFGLGCREGLKRLKLKIEEEKKIITSRSKLKLKDVRKQKKEKVYESSVEAAKEPIQIPEKFLDMSPEKLWATMREIQGFKLLASQAESRTNDFLNRLFPDIKKSIFEFLADTCSSKENVSISLEDLHSRFGVDPKLSEEEKEKLNREFYYPLMSALKQLTETQDSLSENDLDSLNDNLSDFDIEVREDEEAALQNRDVDIRKDRLGWWNDGIPLRGVEILSPEVMEKLRSSFPNAKQVFKMEAYGVSTKSGRQYIYFDENGLNSILEGKESFSGARVRKGSSYELLQDKRIMKFGEKLLAVKLEKPKDLLMLKESGGLKRSIGIEKELLKGMNLGLLKNLKLRNRDSIESFDISEDALADILITLISNTNIKSLSKFLKTSENGQLFISVEEGDKIKLQNLVNSSIRALYDKEVEKKDGSTITAGFNTVAKSDFYKTRKLRRIVLDNMSKSDLFDETEQMLIMARKASDLDGSGKIDTVYEMKKDTLLGFIPWGRKKVELSRAGYEYGGWETDSFVISETKTEEILSDLILDGKIKSKEDFKKFLKGIRKKGENLILVRDNIEKIMDELDCSEEKAEKMKKYLDEQRGEITEENALKAGMYAIQILGYSRGRDLYSELFHSSAGTEGKLEFQSVARENDEAIAKNLRDAYSQVRDLGIFTEKELDEIKGNPVELSFGAKISEEYTEKGTSTTISGPEYTNWQDTGPRLYNIGGVDREMTTQEINDYIHEHGDVTITIPATGQTFDNFNDFNNFIESSRVNAENLENIANASITNLNFPQYLDTSGNERQPTEQERQDWINQNRQQIEQSIVGQLTTDGITANSDVDLNFTDQLDGSTVPNPRVLEFQKEVNGVMHNCTMTTEVRNQQIHVTIKLDTGDTITYVVTREGVLSYKQKQTRQKKITTSVKKWGKIGRKLTLQFAAMKNFAKGSMADGAIDWKIYGGAVLQQDVPLNSEAKSDFRAYLKAGEKTKIKLADWLDLKGGVASSYEIGKGGSEAWNTKGELSLQANMKRFSAEAGIEGDLVGEKLFYSGEGISILNLVFRGKDIDWKLGYAQSMEDASDFWRGEISGRRSKEKIKKELEGALKEFTEKFKNLGEEQKEKLIVMIFGEENSEKLTTEQKDKFFKSMIPVLCQEDIQKRFVGDLMGAGVRFGEIGPEDFISLFVEFAICAEVVKKSYPTESAKQDALNSYLLTNIEKAKEIRAVRQKSLKELETGGKNSETGFPIYSVGELIRSSVGSLAESGQENEVKVFIDPRYKNWIVFKDDGTFYFKNPIEGETEIPINIYKELAPSGVVEKRGNFGKDIKIYFGNPHIAEYASPSMFSLNGRFVSQSDMSFSEKQTPGRKPRTKKLDPFEETLNKTRQNIIERRNSLNNIKGSLEAIWKTPEGRKLLENIENAWSISSSGSFKGEKYWEALKNPDSADNELIKSDLDKLSGEARRTLLELYKQGKAAGLKDIEVRTLIIEQIMMRSSKDWGKLKKQPEKYANEIKKKKDFANKRSALWSSQINNWKGFCEKFDGYNENEFDKFDTPDEALANPNDLEGEGVKESLEVNNALVGFMYTKSGAIMTTMMNTTLVHAKEYEVADGIKVCTGYFETCRNPAFFITMDKEKISPEALINIMSDEQVESSKIGVLIKNLAVSLGYSIVPRKSETRVFTDITTEEREQDGSETVTLTEGGQIDRDADFLLDVIRCRTYEITDTVCTPDSGTGDGGSQGGGGRP